MRKPLLALAAVLLASCSHPKVPLGDIAKLGSLEDVMDNQAGSSDPQFKKIGQAKFDDAELAALVEAAERIQATSLKTKEFAKGRAEFEALATKVNDKAKALGAGAAAKDAAAINAALTDMKATCKECHAKFR